MTKKQILKRYIFFIQETIGGWGLFQKVLFHGICLPMILSTALLFAITGNFDLTVHTGNFFYVAIRVKFKSGGVGSLFE